MALRVLHVVESLKPEAGSIAIALRGLFRALQAHGIESKAVTLEGNGAGLDGVVGVTAFEDATARRLAADADVVHLHGFAGDLARTLARAARRAGRPYVVSPYGSLSHGPYRIRSRRERLRGWLGGKRLIRQAAAVTAVNEQERSDLTARDVNRGITLLPVGLSVGEYETPDVAGGDLPAPPEGRCLLLLGPIHPVEGWVPLLKALVEVGVDGDGWAVILAGPTVGDWRKMLEAAVRRKGATDRVLFVAAQDVATQRGWLARASLLAAVSLQVRCPVSILQAVSAGVPVIASPYVSPPGLEDVTHVCRPNREELRGALLRLFGLTDHERSEFARKARDVGRLVFDWPVLVDQYAQLYGGLA